MEDSITIKDFGAKTAETALNVVLMKAKKIAN